MSKIVLGVIYNQGKVLVGKIKHEQLENFGGITHVFPGGKVEDGEALDDAVVREMREETGLETSSVELIHERIHPVTGKETIYFFCRYISGQPTINAEFNDDLEKLEWVAVAELDKLMPTLNPEVKYYLENLSL